MSSFYPQKSFEKSLRSTDSYQVPLTSLSKTEVHKCCTGKSHACGAVKSTNTLPANKTSSTISKLKVTSNEKSSRKNSLSSETVSDSGSEVSSWNSNKNTIEPSAIVAKTITLKRTKSVTGTSSASVQRRRTSESIITPPTNNIRSENVLNSSDNKNERKTEEGSKLKRTSSFKFPPKPTITTKKNGEFNSRLRNSFRNKNELVAWKMLWESSFSLKQGGGKLRNIDAQLLVATEKVKILKLRLLIQVGITKHSYLVVD